MGLAKGLILCYNKASKRKEGNRMKNVLIISSSPRKGGNSETLCEEFYAGATEAGHNAEIVSLRDKNINYCKGCYVCRKRGKCVQDDDMLPLLEKIKEADVLVLATPVYF